MTCRTQQTRLFSHPTPVAWAVAALALVCASQAGAAVTPSGAVNAWPGNPAIGPGDTDLGNVGLFVGNGAAGSLAVDAASFLRTGSLLIGPSGAGNGDGVVTLSGVGTRVELVGDGFSDGVINRLGVGEWGRGALTVSGGAVLDGRANANACLGANHYCNNFIGNAAGSDGSFTVTGAGSQASFLRGFYVGGLAVFRPPVDGFTFGTPGGTTQGRVSVLDGGRLVTEGASMGQGPGGGSPTGSERSFAEMTIRGAGSTWVVTEGVLEARDAFFNMAQHRNAWATTTIDQGGRLQLEGSDTRYSGVGVGWGGRADMVLRDAGSLLTFTQRNAVLHVGRSSGSTGTLEVLTGAAITQVSYAGIGRDGGFGTLSVDGAGSLLSLTNNFTAAANGATGTATMDIGRNGGTGVVNVRNGGRIEVLTTLATTNGNGFSLGRDAASSGTMNIGSAGVVQVSAASVVPGGGPGEAWNPLVRIGRDGSGNLNITGGGQLLIHGGAVSTPVDPRGTSLYVGGTSSNAPGGKGIASVSGAGSLISVTGSDAYLAVGIGPGSTGQLSVSNQAQVVSTIMNIGRAGVGVLMVDNARIDLSGQYIGSGQFGAAISIGNLGGIGTASFSNGAVMRIENLGSSGASLNLGGTIPNPLGDGSLTLSSGSRVEVVTAPGLATVSVGRDGSGLLRMKGGSSLDLGDGSLYVGRLAGGDGTVVATEGSTIRAGWVGVGRDKTDTGSVDGGTGTMVLNGATLVADQIVIGTNGYLGGSAGSIVANQVTNYGIFSPGSSPGTFTVDASFSAALGSRLILEVAFENGQFVTDRVNFMQGRALDLGALNVEFRFLGDTSPDLFQASGGFVIDTFLAQQDAGGELSGLAPEVFQQVQFSASAEAYRFDSFSFSAESGAVFSATPVPEPAVWLLLLTGATLLRWRARSVVRA